MSGANTKEHKKKVGKKASHSSRADIPQTIFREVPIFEVPGGQSYYGLEKINAACEKYFHRSFHDLTRHQDSSWKRLSLEQQTQVLIDLHYKLPEEVRNKLQAEWEVAPARSSAEIRDLKDPLSAKDQESLALRVEVAELNARIADLNVCLENAAETTEKKSAEAQRLKVSLVATVQSNESLIAEIQTLRRAQQENELLKAKVQTLQTALDSEVDTLLSELRTEFAAKAPTDLEIHTAPLLAAIQTLEQKIKQLNLDRGIEIAHATQEQQEKSRIEFNSVRAHLQNEIEALSHQVAVLSDEKKYYIPASQALQLENTHLLGHLKLAEQEIARSALSKDQLDHETEALKQSKEEISVLKRKFEHAKVEINGLQEKSERLKEKSDHHRVEAETLRAKLASAKTEMGALKQANEEVTSYNRNLSSRCQHLSFEKDSLNRKIEDLSCEIRVREEQKIRSIENMEAEIKKSSGVRISKLTGQVSDLITEIQGLKSALRDTEAQVLRVKEETRAETRPEAEAKAIIRAAQEAKRLEGMQSVFAEFDLKLQKNRKEINELKAQLEEVTKSRDHYHEQYLHFCRVLNPESENTIKTLQEEIASLRAQAASHAAAHVFLSPTAAAEDPSTDAPTPLDTK